MKYRGPQEVRREIKRLSEVLSCSINTPSQRDKYIGAIEWLGWVLNEESHQQYPRSAPMHRDSLVRCGVCSTRCFAYRTSCTNCGAMMPLNQFNHPSVSSMDMIHSIDPANGSITVYHCECGNIYPVPETNGTEHRCPRCGTYHITALRNTIAPQDHASVPYSTQHTTIPSLAEDEDEDEEDLF